MAMKKSSKGWESFRQARLEATKEKRAKEAEYALERIIMLKEHGICIRCGHADAAPNRVACPACLEKNAKYIKQKRMEAREAIK